MSDIDRIGPWRTSSRSGSEGGQCVQTRAAVAARRVVRVHLGDSKLPDTPILDMNASEFGGLLAALGR